MLPVATTTTKDKVSNIKTVYGSIGLENILVSSW